MGKKLADPAIRRKVVHALATGKSQAETAREIGMDPGAFSRAIRREDIKGLVEEEHRKLAEAVPDAARNMIALIRGFDGTKGKDRELAFKASADLLKSFGLLPTAAPSNLTQMYVQVFPVVINRAQNGRQGVSHFGGGVAERKGYGEFLSQRN